MVNVERMTNREFLQNMLKINEAYANEHPNEPECLSQNCKKMIEDVLEESKKINDDDELTNAIFNKFLNKNQKII